MEYGRINASEISVIVQGPIALGESGTPSGGFTDLCLKSVRKHFPGATIILSTWVDSDTNGLDFDELIESKDPGSNVMGSYQSNCFRQITSSVNGLRASKTKYAFKIRTDIAVRNDNVLKYFLKSIHLNFDTEYKVLNQRVVTLTTCNPHRRTKWPFNICDWIFFGLSDDVLNIFDIPLESIKTESGEINPITPEQYIWTKFLSKYKNISLTSTDDISHDNIDLSERYFANNCFFLSAQRAGVIWLKSPGGAYAQLPALSNSGLYTYTEYKRLLNKYANNRLFIIPNIFESIIYAIIYHARFVVKKLVKVLRGKDSVFPL